MEDEVEEDEVAVEDTGDDIVDDIAAGSSDDDEEPSYYGAAAKSLSRLYLLVITHSYVIMIAKRKLAQWPLLRWAPPVAAVQELGLAQSWSPCPVVPFLLLVRLWIWKRGAWKWSVWRHNSHSVLLWIQKTGEHISTKLRL